MAARKGLTKTQIMAAVNSFKLNNDYDFLAAASDLDGSGIRQYLESKGFTVLKNYDTGRNGLVITLEGITVSTNGWCCYQNARPI